MKQEICKLGRKIIRKILRAIIIIRRDVKDALLRKLRIFYDLQIQIILLYLLRYNYIR